jgi:hypothetical protein
MNPLSFLKARFSRPLVLTPGSVFAIGSEARAPEPDSLWRVRQIRDYVGIPHASIEQIATGVTKTVAVSALLGDRTFHVVTPAA